MRLRFSVFLMALFLVFNVQAGVEIQRFENSQQQQQYKKLIDELRCLVCQNQNLADSDAELAQDLRQKVATMIIANKSEDEIIDYMVARYGDFVLYRPPFNLKTVLLWLGPFLILLIGVMVLTRFVRKQQMEAADEVANEEIEKARDVLGQQEDKK